MKLIYKDEKTKQLCNDNKKALKKFGEVVSRKLFDLINILEKSKNLLDIMMLPFYRLHKLKGDRSEQYSLTIHKSSKYRLIILPFDENKNMLICDENEKKLLVNAVIIEIIEVSEHYE